jgi:DNA invertase Pin-like site-specific DNA recombinase
MALEVTLLETVGPPKYQQIAERALQLNKLGLSKEAIARHIGINGKTVAKALSWMMDRS